MSRIVPVGSQVSGVKLSVYGKSKTGKTRLACTFPKPLLLIGTEDGTKSVSGTKEADFIRVTASSDISELVEMLKGGKYKSACLDTAGGLQDIIVKEVLGLDEIPMQRSWGMARQQDWGVIGVQTKKRLSELLSLAESHALNVVIIAHERNFSDEGSSDVMIPSIGSALTPSAAGWLNGACDYICQTYIREQVVPKTVTVAGKQSTINQTTGKKEYCLRVGPHPVFMTGFRLPEGVELPDSIVNPDFNKIQKLIKGEK